MKTSKNSKNRIEQTEKKETFVTPYAHFTKGHLTIYGNSCKIEHEHQALDASKKFRYAIKKLFSKSKYDNIKDIDTVFEDHVLRHGQNFDKVDNPLFELYLKEESEREKKRTSNQPPERKKGDIKTFSRSSRRRMLKKINRLNFDTEFNPFWITLTYPSKYPENSTEYKRDLSTFIKRAKRKAGNDMKYLWRLEFQQRGAPHFHMALIPPKKIELQVMKQWVSDNWFEVVQRNWHEKDEKHQRVGTNVQLLNSFNAFKYYVSKYMAKLDSEKVRHPGRFWGTSTNWEDVIEEDVELKPKQLIQFKRIMKRYIKTKHKATSRRLRKSFNIELWGNKETFLRALNWCRLAY